MRVYHICSVAIIASLLTTVSAKAANNTTTVAPNLMIIFSTAFSMNREMNDVTYPSVDIDGDGVERDELYRFDDIGFDQWNPDGVQVAPAPWNSSGSFLSRGHSNLPGNQPSSKLYQSKQAFFGILNDDTLSKDINIGFSTFRQIFGLSMATTDSLTTATYPEVFPPGGNPFEDLSNRGDPADPASLHPTNPSGNDIFKASNPDKNAFANDMTNFSSVRWWRQWFAWKTSGESWANWNDWNNPGPTPCAYLYSGAPSYGNPFLGGSGGKYYEAGRGFLDDSFTTFIDNNKGDGGLPLKFRYRNEAVDNSTGRTECSIDDTDWPWGVENTTGARSANEASSGEPMVEHYLCRTWYDSQQNEFRALYNANRPFRHAYPGRYSGYGVYRAIPGLYLFNDAGLLVDRDGNDQSTTSYPLACTTSLSYPENTLKRQTQRVSDQLRAWGPLAGESSLTPAYFSEVPHYWEGLSSSTAAAQVGALTGWSGETTYERDCGGSGTECVTASYPSRVADPCDDSRNLCPNTTNANDPDKMYRYVKTMGADLSGNSRHMGVFLDLPDPVSGYVDQRAVLKDFMGYEQMALDGNDYNPNAAIPADVIAGDKGLAASSHPWQQHQSPIYQSLLSAYAYYEAYKVADTSYDSCRSNNILLFYDGKEDARWEIVGGVKVYAKPEEMAAKLYNDLGVRVHVVIMSSNSGDISQADLIAASGGTGSAYSAQSLADLKTALATTFSSIGLTGEVSEVTPAIPSLTKAGSKVFLAGSEQSPGAGHLRAYTVASDGVVGSVADWDAADEMTVAERKNRLWSINSGGDLVTFENLDDAAFEVSGLPDVSTIKEYTFDPSYDSEAYLMNRKSGSLLGAIKRGNYTFALNVPRDPALWRDTDYRQFVIDRKNRTPLVLSSSVDGFLYAFKQSDGDLLWGWTPRSLVKEMKSYGTFQIDNYMSGRIYAIDAKKNSSSNYATYIAGAAQSGAMYYVLKLKNNGQLKALVWEEDYAGHTSPGEGEPQFWRHDDKVYVIYVVNNSAGVSRLVIRNVARKNDKLEVTGLPFKVTAVPLVSDKNELYLGDENGNVYSANLLDGSGVLKADTVLLADLSVTSAKLGNFIPSTSPALPVSELTYLGIAKSTDGKRYLRAQSTSRLTIFREDDVAGVPTWRRAWTSSIGSAGYWNADDTSYTADTSGSPGIDGEGYYTAQTSGVPTLPASAKITDAATIAGDAVILPVALAMSTGTCSSLDVAYYYFYDLATGKYPAGKFANRDSNGIDSHKRIGFGQPNRLVLTASGPDDVLGIDSADQLPDETTGVGRGFKILGGQRSGRNSWRELIR